MNPPGCAASPRAILSWGENAMASRDVEISATQPISDDPLTMRLSSRSLPAAERRRSFPVENWDRYQFVAFIGEGGMGRVFKGWDPRLKRHVALKFLGLAERHADRFVREAQLQARLEHPNICQVFE